jgi:D-psicose/D-tagatose/L-ribulose 3-epimerase
LGLGFPTVAAVTEIAPRVKVMGFDLLELGVEHPGDWDPARVAEILAANDLGAVDSPAVGALLDTFHMNIEEKDQAAAIRLVGDKLAHFHACGNDRGTPGADHIPWETITAALREIGYDGAVVIESFTPDNQTIARAAAIWRPLAETQDALAEDGLAFLRGQFH